MKLQSRFGVLGRTLVFWSFRNAIVESLGNQQASAKSLSIRRVFVNSAGNREIFGFSTFIIQVPGYAKDTIQVFSLVSDRV